MEKKKSFLFTAGIAGVLFFCLSGSYAQEIPVQKLLKHPERFNQQEVSVIGEVIGDPLKAKEGMWVNILSRGYNIGMLVPSGELAKISSWGSYEAQGDIIKVKGVFYTCCPWEEERDIHVTSLEIVKKGFPIEENVPRAKITLAIISSIICLTFCVIYLIKLKYGK